MFIGTSCDAGEIIKGYLLHHFRSVVVGGPYIVLHLPRVYLVAVSCLVVSSAPISTTEPIIANVNMLVSGIHIPAAFSQDCNSSVFALGARNPI